MRDVEVMDWVRWSPEERRVYIGWKFQALELIMGGITRAASKAF